MNMHYIYHQKRLLIKIITELISKNRPRQHQEIIITTNIYEVLPESQTRVSFFLAARNVGS